MKCKNCNHEITDDSNFCEYCGVPIKNSWGQYVFFAIYILYLAFVPVHFGFFFCALITIATGSLLYRQSGLLRLFFILTLIIFGVLMVFLFFIGSACGAFSSFCGAVGDMFYSCPG